MKLTAGCLFAGLLLTVAYPATSAEKPAHFCRHYAGAINGTIRIRMNLCAHPDGNAEKRDSAALAGSYFYESKGMLLYLSGAANGDGSFTLTETNDLQKETGRIVGKIDGKTVSGQWKSIDGKKSLNVELKEDYSDAVELKTIYVDEVHKYKNSKAGPELRMTWLVVQPASSDCPADCQKVKGSVLKTLFGKDYVQGTDMQGNMRKVAAGIVKAFDDDNAEIEKEPGSSEDRRPANDWSTEWEVRPVFNDYNILTLDFYNTEYSGGAHPSYYDTFAVYDSKTGEKITMDQIFKDGTAAALSKLMIKKLDAYFKKLIDDYKGLKDVLMDGDLKAVKPNDNFFVTKGGVGFHFNIYEITPYAVGSFDAFIPFNELKGLLKENSPISHLAPPASSAKP
jgi:hypothetical protein